MERLVRSLLVEWREIVVLYCPKAFVRGSILVAKYGSVTRRTRSDEVVSAVIQSPSTFAVELEQAPIFTRFVISGPLTRIALERQRPCFPIGDILLYPGVGVEGADSR